MRRSKGDGFHITKVGLWFLVFLLIVAAAATNTGNNGLFLVLAVMGAAVLVSEALGRLNVRGLAVELSAPVEIFANSPSHLEVSLTNRGRWLARWLLVVTVEPTDIEPASRRPKRRAKPFLVSHLPQRSQVGGRLELLMRRRGRLRIRHAHFTSLFPLGFFRKGRRTTSGLELVGAPTHAPSLARSNVRTETKSECRVGLNRVTPASSDVTIEIQHDRVHGARWLNHARVVGDRNPIPGSADVRCDRGTIECQANGAIIDRWVAIH